MNISEYRIIKFYLIDMDFDDNSLKCVGLFVFLGGPEYNQDISTAASYDNICYVIPLSSPFLIQLIHIVF
jgi:hypothetical protein